MSKLLNEERRQGLAPEAALSIGAVARATPVNVIVGRLPEKGKLHMHALSLAKRAEVVAHLVEGSGVRATSRLLNVHRDTITRLLALLGEGCDRLHARLVRDLNVTYIEADELHSFVHTRAKNLRPGALEEHGEQWVWIALARSSKVVLSYRVGRRDEQNARAFMLDLRSRLNTIPVLCTDAFNAYPAAVEEAFAGSVDYSQVVKSFTGRRNAKDYDKVAPANGPPMVSKRVVYGAPDLSKCSTSIAEREMLSIRTHLRRFVRRGTGFSKCLRNHRAAISLFVSWYNLCRVHKSLRVTPGMQVGITNRVWSIEELIEAALAAEPFDAPAPEPLKIRDGSGPARALPRGGFLRLVKSA